MNSTAKLFTLLVVLLSFAACSSSKENEVKKKGKGKTSERVKKSPSQVLSHLHTIANCENIVMHSHANATEQHEHKLSCKKASNKPSNAHIHPASKGYRSFRHVHPNGYTEHNHH